MISAKFLWGTVLFGGKPQIGAKNSNFDIFERAVNMKSVSMPLTYCQIRVHAFTLCRDFLVLFLRQFSITMSIIKGVIFSLKCTCLLYSLFMRTHVCNFHFGCNKVLFEHFPTINKKLLRQD